MKKLVVALMVCAMAVPGFAQKQDPKKKELHCAVMKEDKVDTKKATKSKMFSDYKGRRYYFCCAGCKPKFDADPEAYKGGDSTPIPKKKKG